MKTLDRMCQKAHATAVDKGWWEESRGIPECLALIHSEVSEALEAFRVGDKGTSIAYDGITKKPEGLAVEMADILIRVFDVCAAFNIPLADALAVKMTYNKTRSKRHGGKIC